LGLTLRYSFEVRKRAQYFEDIPELKLPKVMLDLTTHNSCFRQHRPIAEVVGGRASCALLGVRCALRAVEHGAEQALCAPGIVPSSLWIADFYLRAIEPLIAIVLGCMRRKNAQALKCNIEKG